MMSQLLSPSAALGGAFELPEVATESDQHQIQSAQISTTLNAYALGLQHFGLLLPVDTPSALIESDLPSCRLPNTPHWLECMMNWNGIIVPIFLIESLLEFDEPDTQTLKIIIIGQGEEAVGLRVVQDPFRITLRDEEKLTRNPPLPQALQPFTRGCYRTDRIWVDWDYRGFFDAVTK